MYQRDRSAPCTCTCTDTNPIPFEYPVIVTATTAAAVHATHRHYYCCTSAVRTYGVYHSLISYVLVHTTQEARPGVPAVVIVKYADPPFGATAVVRGSIFLLYETHRHRGKGRGQQPLPPAVEMTSPTPTKCRCQSSPAHPVLRCLRDAA